MATATTRPAVWDEEELKHLGTQDAETASDTAANKYNPTPGTGRTGFLNVPPNKYPFFCEEEKYVAVMQADGGQLSEWTPMYNPTAEQAEVDRKVAYEAGVPHGFVPPGDAYKGLTTLPLLVVSELHEAHEYGANVNDDGIHSGGPFWIDVSLKMRVEDLRKVIRDKGGILPGLQKLSYAGKNMEDSQRTLQHYGVGYWQKRFPNWPIKIRRCDSLLPNALPKNVPP